MCTCRLGEKRKQEVVSHFDAEKKDQIDDDFDKGPKKNKGKNKEKGKQQHSNGKSKGFFKKSKSSWTI